MLKYITVFLSPVWIKNASKLHLLHELHSCITKYNFFTIDIAWNDVLKYWFWWITQVWQVLSFFKCFITEFWCRFISCSLNSSSHWLINLKNDVLINDSEFDLMSISFDLRINIISNKCSIVFAFNSSRLNSMQWSSDKIQKKLHSIYRTNAIH